jgi:2-iminoacetate synthase
LQKHCWKAQVSISFPRMRPATGGYQPEARCLLSDRQFVQLVCAFRWLLPHAGITLSTREPAALRDGMIPLGVTLMSAGASTEPGGYSHFDEANWSPTQAAPGEQFAIADERPPSAIAQAIRDKGCEAVWKDADASLVQV